MYNGEMSGGKGNELKVWIKEKALEYLKRKVKISALAIRLNFYVRNLSYFVDSFRKPLTNLCNTLPIKV